MEGVIMGVHIIALDWSWNVADLFQRHKAMFIPGLKSCAVSSVKDMVSQVLKTAGGNKIERLIIAGHGAPAFQSVGCGQKGDTSGDRSLQLSGTKGKLLGDAASAIPKLAGRFTNNGIVTLSGCQVAGEETHYYSGVAVPVHGPDLLRAVSRALGGISVEAGTFYQNTLSLIPLGNLIRCNDDSCKVVNNWYDLMWRGY
jgi:hypothetical protein